MGSPRRRWIVSAAALVAAACSFAPAAASADPAETPVAGGGAQAGHAPDRVIVRYRAGTDSGERADVRDDVDATSARPLDLARTELVHLPAGSSVSAAVRELESAPDVEFAQPDYLYRPEAVPNDPLFGTQWNFRNTGQLIGGVNGTADADIDAPEAWDVTTGSDSVTVAVVDSGVNVDHADIAPNVYTNDEELNGTAGVDDDGNGKTDDVHGWDFVNNNPTVADDLDEHGTLVASVLGARGDNGIGVSGVMQHVRILPLQVRNGDGTLSTSAIVNAVAYARDAGARIVNMSFGFFGADDTADRAAVRGAPGVLFSTSAGNFAPSSTAGSDNDATPHWPSQLTKTEDNVVASANTTNQDLLATSSSYGKTSVDLAAPGTDIPGASLHTVFSESFDSTSTGSLPSGWTTDGSWAVTNETAISQPSSLSDSPGGDYASGSDTSATSAAFSVPAGAVCFVKNVRNRATQEGADFFNTEYSLGGGAWNVIDSRSGTPDSPGFVSASPSFSTGGSTSARIRFRIIADSDAITADGVHVDNVNVRCSGGSGFQTQTGTSFSAPTTAGAAALLLARDPTLTPADLKSILRTTVDPLPGLAAKTISGGRLNVGRAVHSLVAPVAATGAADGVTDVAASLHGTVTPNGSPTTAHFEYQEPGAATWTETTPTSVGEDAGSVGVSAKISNLAPNTTYDFRLVADKPRRSGEGSVQTFTTAATPPVVVGSGQQPPVLPLQPTTPTNPMTPVVPAKDTRKPVISGLVVAPSAFRPLARGALIALARRAPRGAVVRLRLSEPARLAMRVLQPKKGKRARGICAKPTRANRAAKSCTRLVPLGSASVNRIQGVVRRSLTGRVGRRALKPGSYRLEVTATDAAGNRSKAATARFRIIR